jgi:flagellar hook protein FlgE
MFVGYTGLATNTIGMRAVADNVANLNTTGYKESKVEFMNQLVRTCDVFGEEKGCGSFIKHIVTLYSPGPIQSTDRPTDLAISGKGFFIVSDSDGNIFYTRDGEFYINEVDEEHFALQNSLGMYLLGADPNATQADLDSLKPYLIPKKMDAKATSVIQTQLVFDSRIETNTQSLLEKYNYTTSPDHPISENDYDWVWDLPIYDNLGDKINLKLYADRGDSPNEYEILVALDDPELDGRGDGTFKGAFLYGILNFGGSGEIQSAEFYNIPSPDSNVSDILNSQNQIDLTSTGKPSFTLNLNGNTQAITLDLGFSVNSDGSINRSGNSSKLLASAFAQLFYNQDGYPAGIFDKIEIITEEGLIKAWYTNGKDINVSKIFLADFTGYEDSLQKKGSNLFQPDTGVEPVIFAPGSEARGEIISGALELSNVDLADQMVDLIMLQRAFQSNARVITTADEILAEFLRQT